MCGIAGFSLTPNSKIKTRQLANAMLTAIEDRGYMASGFGYWHNDTMGYHSEATPGSSLSLKFLPRQAKTVILHTRLATHGSVNDNRNNHPVLSPTGDIALVHNGVIYNHQQVRAQLSGNLPPVDTSVIPAVIEQHGTAALNVLNGDAAIAWLNRSEQGVLHLARYQHSPLVIAHVEDGSFVFASTEQLLWRVLIQLDITPTWMYSPSELEYFTIRNGVINERSMLPEPMFTESKYDYGYYRHQTAGAKGATPAQSYYYGDDWWDDEFDDAYWIGNPPAPKEIAPRSNPTNKYWTMFKEELDDRADYLYYAGHEHELWVNELYMLANEPGVQLVDYGQVLDSGELVSTLNDNDTF